MHYIMHYIKKNKKKKQALILKKLQTPSHWFTVTVSPPCMLP